MSQKETQDFSDLLKRLANNPKALEALLSGSKVESNNLFSRPQPKADTPGPSGINQVAAPTLFNKLGDQLFKKKRNSSPMTKDFRRKIVLLKTGAQTLTAEELAELENSGCVMTGHPLRTDLTYQEVKNELYRIFEGKIPDKSEIEFVHLNGKSISKVCTARGVKIDGQFLKDSTRTVIYVRPKKNYSSSDSSDSDSSDSDKLNDPIFLPKKTAAGSSKRKVSRSDDCVSVPRKLSAHGSKPQVNTPSTQEPGILLRDGRYYWVDEDGHEHLLDDNTSTDVQEITKNNIAEGNVNTQKSFQQSLRDYQKRISLTVFNIVVARSTALNELYSYLDDKEFSCLSNLSVRFKNEKGVGTGVKKELLSVLLQQLKASPLLEGNEFRKTLVSSRPAERNGEYFKMGQIISLVLLHGGPAPTFFSEIFWKLLIDEEITEVTLDDLLNETVRSQIMAVLQSGESSALINAVYVECDIFKAARTHEQIIGPDPVLKRDEAIKDVLHYYCIEVLKGPINQFRMGLNKEVPFVSAFKQDPVQAKKLFCYSPDVHLTAATVRNLFVGKLSSTHDRVIYNYWLQYVDFLQDHGTEKHNLHRLLQLATGLSDVPPLGFRLNRPTVSVKELCFPKSQTCFNELYLPGLVTNYEEFQACMEIGMDLMELDDV